MKYKDLLIQPSRTKLAELITAAASLEERIKGLVGSPPILNQDQAPTCASVAEIMRPVQRMHVMQELALKTYHIVFNGKLLTVFLYHTEYNLSDATSKESIEYQANILIALANQVQQIVAQTISYPELAEMSRGLEGASIGLRETVAAAGILPVSDLAPLGYAASVVDVGVRTLAAHTTHYHEMDMLSIESKLCNVQSAIVHLQTQLVREGENAAKSLEIITRETTATKSVISAMMMSTIIDSIGSLQEFELGAIRAEHIKNSLGWVLDMIGHMQDFIPSATDKELEEIDAVCSAHMLTTRHLIHDIRDLALLRCLEAGELMPLVSSLASEFHDDVAAAAASYGGGGGAAAAASGGASGSGGGGGGGGYSKIYVAEDIEMSEILAESDAASLAYSPSPDGAVAAAAAAATAPHSSIFASSSSISPGIAPCAATSAAAAADSDTPTSTHDETIPFHALTVDTSLGGAGDVDFDLKAFEYPDSRS